VKIALILIFALTFAKACLSPSRTEACLLRWGPSNSRAGHRAGGLYGGAESWSPFLRKEALNATLPWVQGNCLVLTVAEHLLPEMGTMSQLSDHPTYRAPRHT